MEVQRNVSVKGIDRSWQEFLTICFTESKLTHFCDDPSSKLWVSPFKLFWTEVILNLFLHLFVFLSALWNKVGGCC